MVSSCSNLELLLPRSCDTAHTSLHIRPIQWCDFDFESWAGARLSSLLFVLQIGLNETCLCLSIASLDVNAHQAIRVEGWQVTHTPHCSDDSLSFVLTLMPV